jgi:hypothetical protein
MQHRIDLINEYMNPTNIRTNHKVKYLKTETLVSSEPIVSELSRALSQSARYRRSANIRLFQIIHKKSFVDSAIKLIFSIDLGTNKDVIYVSPPDVLNEVKREQEAARYFKAFMEPPLGEVIPETVMEGQILGRSYAIVPFFKPISTYRYIAKWEQWRLTSAVLKWLEALAAKQSNDIDAFDRYERCLHALADEVHVAAPLRQFSRDALNLLNNSSFSPRDIPMHGDLYQGNILWAKRYSTFPFVLIDWGAANVQGYPIYDLIHFSAAFGLPRRKLQQALRSHSRILGCSVPETSIYLMAALGHVFLNRGKFPIYKFNEMATQWISVWSSATIF